MRHEAQRREHTNTCKNFEGRVSKASDQSSSGNVRLLVEVRGVGQHNSKANREREEDLSERSKPYLGLNEGTPIRCEERTQAF